MAGNPFTSSKFAAGTGLVVIVFSALTGATNATAQHIDLQRDCITYSSYTSNYLRPIYSPPPAVLPKIDLAFEAPGRRLEPLAAPPPAEAPKATLAQRVALRLFGAKRDRVPLRSRPGFNAAA